MVPSRVVGGLAHSSTSSGIIFQGDGQSQAVGNSHLSSSFGNSPNPITGSMHSNLGPVSGDLSHPVFNSVANSGPSVGASSLVTDANSGLSGGPHLQRSASFNTDSYMRLPASPLSFSSNNLSISGSTVMDGSSMVQQCSNQDPSPQQFLQRQLQGTSSASSLPTQRLNQVSLPSGPRLPDSFLQESNTMSQLQKKPRLDIKQEDVLQQQVLQQILQRPESMQLTNQNPQLQALIQQQRLRQQQQQLLQSMPPVQRAHLLQQQQQLQLRQQLQQQQGMQPVSSVKRPYEGGVCSRRLMQYLYHQRQRPPENTIAYWRKFVAEYYSPRAKRRWCLSLYDNVGHHSLGVFPQATMDVWQCDICNSKSGRGFEATFEVLPRLNEIKFGSGVIDELLFLDLPRECRFLSGMMMLEYGKAVQESVYEQLRVVREGQLRIVFTPDLKILSWEFCARRHEELLPRKLVAPQVNQLLQVAQKCQSTIAESGADGVSQQDLQTNSNMVLTAGRQLARTLELQSLNDLGFSKRYVRCLQIAEVVNSMKDLMDYSRDKKIGAIEGLKVYPRHEKIQMQKMQEMDQQLQLAGGGGIQGLPSSSSDPNNALNNKQLMALHPSAGGGGINNSQMAANNHLHQQMVGRGGTLSGGSSPSAAAMAALSSSHQNMMTRQNSMNNDNNNNNSNPNNSLQQQQQAASPSLSNNSNQNPPPPFQGTANTGSLQNLPVSGFSTTNMQQQQQQHQHRLLSVNNNGLVQQQNNHHHLQGGGSSSQAALQQQMFQQLLHHHGMNNTNNPLSGERVQPPEIGGGVSRGGGLGFGGSNNNNSTSMEIPPSSNNRPMPSRSNSFKAASSNSSDQNRLINQKAAAAPDLLAQQNMHLADDDDDDEIDMVPDIGGHHDFTENGFFNTSDLLDDDSIMGFGWKS